MPNPLHLQVMGITLSEYNTYSPAKKARFQATAQKKLTEVSADAVAFTELTKQTHQANLSKAEAEEFSVEEDKENS